MVSEEGSRVSGLLPDPRAGPVLTAAVTGLDEAIIDVRHLMLTVLGPSAGAAPGGGTERLDQPTGVSGVTTQS